MNERSTTVQIFPNTDPTTWKHQPLNAAIRKHIAGKYRKWRSEGVSGRIYARAYYLTNKKWERHILYGESW